jgi:ADP-ribosylglycohydrolase
MDLSKAKGMIYGLAIGDALGYPVEFMTLQQIKGKHGPSGMTDLPSPAIFSDDTQMTIAIAEALIRAGEKEIETIMEATKEEFIQWFHSPENNRAPGRTCLTGVANMERGIHWTKSGVANSKGCGSAMRVAPIGYLYQQDPAKLKAVAHATGICTHGHPTADAACIGAAYLVKLALDGVYPRNMIQALSDFTAEISQEFDEAILKVAKCLDWEDEERALKYLGEGWIGEEAVALALYCFLRYPDSYEKAVIRVPTRTGISIPLPASQEALAGLIWGLMRSQLIGSRELKNRNICKTWPDGCRRKRRAHCKRIRGVVLGVLFGQQNRRLAGWSV